MLLGALATGVSGVVVITLLRSADAREGDAPSDRVSVFFGLGIVLMSHRTIAASGKAASAQHLWQDRRMVWRMFYLIGGLSLAALLVCRCLKEFSWWRSTRRRARAGLAVGGWTCC